MKNFYKQKTIAATSTINEKCMNIAKHDMTISGVTHPEIIFLRVSPDNLQGAILLVLRELAEDSWLSRLDDETVQESFRLAASQTVSDIETKIKDPNGNNDASKAGQYLVSHLAKKAIVSELSHEEVPLMELLSRRVSGGEGFDFYSEKLSDSLIVCGEAKFVSGRNAYTDSLVQIKDFIDTKKHILDIQVICHFTSEAGRKKLVKGQHGVCAAFSTTNIQTDVLVNNIKASNNLSVLFDKNLIILVGVDVA